MRSENGLAKPKLGTRGVSRPYGLEFVEVGDIKTSAFCSINRCGTVRETLAFLKCQSVGGTVCSYRRPSNNRWVAPFERTLALLEKSLSKNVGRKI